MKVIELCCVISSLIILAVCLIKSFGLRGVSYHLRPVPTGDIIIIITNEYIIAITWIADNDILCSRIQKYKLMVGRSGGHTYRNMNPPTHESLPTSDFRTTYSLLFS
jgi:hypothetical protein